MSKPKPILIVKIEKGADQDEVNSAAKGINEVLGEDYYILVCTNDKDKIEFECFYEKDFTPIKYDELKQIIKDAT